MIVAFRYNILFLSSRNILEREKTLNKKLNNKNSRTTFEVCLKNRVIFFKAII